MSSATHDFKVGDYVATKKFSGHIIDWSESGTYALIRLNNPDGVFSHIHATVKEMTKADAPVKRTIPAAAAAAAAAT